MEPEEILKRYAFSFVGIPYIWGGDDPMKGFDCSGFVIELLKAVGMFPANYDASAQDMFNHFFNLSTHTPEFGSLVFFGKSMNDISHVAFCLNDKTMIEAGGGDKSTKDLSSAIDRNAYIRVRPISNRKDVVAYLLPRYEWIYV